MNGDMVTVRRAKELTGRTVLFCFVAFFGVVAAVNAIMMRAAITTFAGTETASAYKAGLAYKQEEAAAAAQDALRWQVDGRIAMITPDEAILIVAVKDRHGAPVRGLDIAARLVHPLNKRLDHDIALVPQPDGSFRGATQAAAGQWGLSLDMSRGGERVYRTRSRVVLK